MDLPATFVREALLQQPEGKRIRCQVCERRCLLVAGGQGWCRTRVHHNGKIRTLVYGAISSLAVNPIEKKPFYHFHPGSFNLTAGGWSCNFGCPWCQNWSISKTAGETGRYVTPERFVKVAEESGCRGTSVSFNEPTLSLEWALDVFRLARARRLYNTFVTNGYMTPECLALLVDAGLNAMNVDIKGDAGAVRKYCRGVEVEKVWSTCERARSRGVHLEITTLVIPGVNDSEEVVSEIAKNIVRRLSADVPWHVSAYHPAYQFSAPPTSAEKLESVWQIGRDSGLRHVYVGNLPGHRYDNTCCPSCDRLLIQRIGYDVVQNSLEDGACPSCGTKLAGVWN
jgi:pyruvate formate lyase activating enzyme